MVSQSTSKRFPGFASVHLLQEPGNSTAFRVDPNVDVSSARAITRAEINPEQVTVRWAMGRSAPTDTLRMRIAGPVLLAQRVVQLLQREQFSGWRTYPVQVFGKNGESIPDYYGLAVHGRCGRIDNEGSTKVDRIFPGGVFPVWKGVYFDPLTWDGSDLFMPADGTCWIFVVDAVRRAFERAGVKNVTFTALDVMERSVL